MHGNLTLFLLNTPNSLNTVNCCGNTDLPLLMPWDLEFLTVSCLLCWDLTSCSVAFLCFLSGCASRQTDSWCSLVEVIFLDPMHLSHAEISGFARWLISCLDQLLQSRCFLLGYKIKKKRKDSWHPPLRRAKNASECLTVSWFLGYNVGKLKTKLWNFCSTLQQCVQGTPFVPFDSHKSSPWWEVG